MNQETWMWRRLRIFTVKLTAIEKDIVTGIEEALLAVLPEAFSIVKETARRFKENEYIEVTATDLDRDLAAQRNSIQIHG